jgi:cytoskeletal protein RodZ
MQVDADSLGSYLRREREAQHVSLQDISAATKIQLRFLKALEDDAYDQLPPAPFVVGFLRAYADCLALDPEEIVSVYHAHYGIADKLEGQRLPAEVPQIQQPRQYSRKRLSLILGLIIVVLIGGFVWRFSRQGGDINPISSSIPGGGEQASARQPAESEAARLSSDTLPLKISQATSEPVVDAMASQDQSLSTAPQDTEQDLLEPVAAEDVHGEQRPPVVETNSVPDAAETLPSETSSSAQEIPPVASSASLQLQVMALEDTWLRVEIDGEQRHTILLIAGKRVQWEADERFTLTVGNAHGTRLLLNGRDVPLPPTRSNVVRDFVLTRNMVN